MTRFFPSRLFILFVVFVILVGLPELAAYALVYHISCMLALTTAEQESVVRNIREHCSHLFRNGYEPQRPSELKTRAYLIIAIFLSAVGLAALQLGEEQLSTLLLITLSFGMFITFRSIGFQNGQELFKKNREAIEDAVIKEASKKAATS